MRAPLGRASDRLRIERFVKEIEEDPSLVEGGEVGLARYTYSRQKFARFVSVSDLLASSLEAPVSPSFYDLVGWRVRSLGCSMARRGWR